MEQSPEWADNSLNKEQWHSSEYNQIPEIEEISPVSKRSRDKKKRTTFTSKGKNKIQITLRK
jgi:hypothetical protein